MNLQKCGESLADNLSNNYQQNYQNDYQDNSIAGCRSRRETNSEFKKPPDVVVLHRSIPTTYGGRKTIFGFVAVFGAKNEVGVDEQISVGYK